MNRRSLLSLVALLPIVGAFVKPADGVALRSAAHPIGPSLNDLELNPDCLVTSEITLTPYAHAGEQVTCENGHEVCKFTVDVYIGQNQDLQHQLGHWTQEEPIVGGEIPECMRCGAPFYRAGGFFHFKEGWRVRSLPKLFR